jgi:hypothetical protein
VDADRFWELVSLIGGYPPVDEDEAFQPIQTALAALGESEITGFEDTLSRLLYDLDRQEFAALPTIDTGREQSSDSFLYNRCAVVVAGRSSYQSVLEGTRSFQEFTHSHGPSSEPLLYVAEQAFEQLTGREWEHVPPLDYETGTNPAGWE